ncbi:MAG: sodium:proton antiporter [Lachnospiraceae bacterium]|nr:sodium:proton antiporter [Lachnospiraceae bacterium]
MAAGIIAYVLGRYSKKARDFFADAVTVLEISLLAYLSLKFIGGTDVFFYAPDLCGLGISLTLDGFRVVYGMVAAFMWLCTTIFSREYMAHYPRTNRYYMFFLMTLGATVGVFLSADLFTTFLFFEIMSFTSYTWVAHDETKDALRAAETYIAVAVIGGMILLMGLFLLYNITGTLSIDMLPSSIQIVKESYPGVMPKLYTAGACMLVGFGAKAGMFPLHIWLPKAHPVAPAPASALLSGILTKSGIYGVLIISCSIFTHDPGWGFLILVLGVITMFGGALLGIFSINLKRTLACSSMSQIGFILTGIGMQGLLGEENALAMRGTVLHMVNHSLIKLVLFMAAGVVYMNLHELDLNKIRGFGKDKPLLMAAFLTGGLSISGIPGFSGYVSKTLLHESIVEYMHEAGEAAGTYRFIEVVFLITGGMTLAYMTKLFVAVFVEMPEGSYDGGLHNAETPESEVQGTEAHGTAAHGTGSKKYMNAESTLALMLSAAVLLIFGFGPYKFMDAVARMTLPFMQGSEFGESVNYFAFSNLKGGLISIAIGAFIYFVVIRNLLMVKDDPGVIEGAVENGGADGKETGGKKAKAYKRYVDAWPGWLDVENIIYRPLLQHIIPFVLAFVLRIFDRLTDHIVSLTSRTLLKEVEPRRPLLFGNAFTHAVGIFMNRIVILLNKTIRRKSPKQINYEEKLAFSLDTIVKTSRLTSRSVSFGLMMFSLGCIFTLVYLMVVLLLHVGA